MVSVYKCPDATFRFCFVMPMRATRGIMYRSARSKGRVTYYMYLEVMLFNNNSICSVICQEPVQGGVWQ